MNGLDNIINKKDIKIDIPNLDTKINNHHLPIYSFKLQDKENWTRDQILKTNPTMNKIEDETQLRDYQNFLKLINFNKSALNNWERPIFINMVLGGLTKTGNAKGSLNLLLDDIIFNLRERVTIMNEWDDDQYFDYEDIIYQDVTIIKNAFKDNIDKFIRLIVSNYKVKNDYYDFIFSKIRLHGLLISYLDGEDVVFEVAKDEVITALECPYLQLKNFLKLYRIDKNILIPVSEGNIGIQLLMSPIEPLIPIRKKGGSKN
jgi:hypothetical protein